MFAGHFGIATAARIKAPKLPLWSLLVSSQLMDIVFIPFNLAGLEVIEPIGEGGYGNMMIHAFYTHSLVGALILSLIAAFVAQKIWGDQSGLITGAVVFSHWILDLIVHRPDLPILPGNIGDFPLLGFGLWNIIPASIFLELLLISIGAFYYTKTTLSISNSDSKKKKIVLSIAVTAFLFLSLAVDIFL